MPYQEATEDIILSPEELHLRRFGKWFITPVFAIGSGIVSVISCYFLPIFASLALYWLIPILCAVFIAEVALYVYLFKDSVPDTLVDIFINDIFKGLSQKKKILLGIGLFLTLGGGLALAALVFNSTQFALDKVCLLVFSTTTPLGILIPIAALLAIVTLFAYTCVLTKHISLAIRHNLHEKIIKFFKDLFTRDEKIPLKQQIFEGFFQLLFIAFILVVTVIGTIALLGTMEKHLMKFLMHIPQANEVACQGASMAIIYGLTGPARLPFALESVCSSFSRLGKTTGYFLYRSGLFLCRVTHEILFYPFNQARKLISTEKILYIEDLGKRFQISDSFSTLSANILKLSAMLIHGLSFGALAKDGGASVLEDMGIPPETAGDLSAGTASMMSMSIGAYYLFPEAAAKTSSPTNSEEEIPLITSFEQSVVV